MNPSHDSEDQVSDSDIVIGTHKVLSMRVYEGRGSLGELDGGERAAHSLAGTGPPRRRTFRNLAKAPGDARTGHQHDRAGYWPATAVCPAMGRRLPDLSCIHTATAAPAIGGRGRCPPPNVTFHPAVSSLR